MKNIKYVDLEPNNNNPSDRTFKTLLSLLLIVVVFTMASSFFSFIKPAMAVGTLTSVDIVSSNNIVNTKSTYDIIFNTATTGTIKTINMTFPSGFDVSAAKNIERTGIGSGWLSATSSSTLTYTVNNAVSIPAGTTIRLEIGKIVNSNTAGSFRISIATADTASVIIDGPTLSRSFPIKDITGDDVSPSFMIRKTLYDDDAGHVHGWDPNGSTKSFAIFDPDISGASDSEFINVMIRYANLVYCTASPGDTGLFVVHCDSAPVDSAVLDYVTTKLPANVVTSTETSTFTSSSPTSSTSSQDITSFARHDDIASEFP